MHGSLPLSLSPSLPLFVVCEFLFNARKETKKANSRKGRKGMMR